MVLDGKSSQEYPVYDGVPVGSILGPTHFLLYINDLPDDIICNIAIYADGSTLCSKCDQASNLSQQLKLASKLESGPRDTLDWSMKWLFYFSAGKTQLVSFDCCYWCENEWVCYWGKIVLKMLGLNIFGKLLECMEYCCNVWAGVPSCFLELLV